MVPTILMSPICLAIDPKYGGSFSFANPKSQRAGLCRFMPDDAVHRQGDATATVQQQYSNGIPTVLLLRSKAGGNNKKGVENWRVSKKAALRLTMRPINFFGENKVIRIGLKTHAQTIINQCSYKVTLFW